MGWRALFAIKPQPEKIFESFLFLMAGNLSDFQAANISFLKMFLYGVENAGPRHETPEMKIQKMSLLWLWTENNGYFNFETFQMNFEDIWAVIVIYQRLIRYCGRLWVKMRQKR